MANRARSRNGKPVLTAMEQAFVSAYVGGATSAVQAAAEAGYKSPQKLAFILMQKPHVMAEIERRPQALREREESQHPETARLLGVRRDLRSYVHLQAGHVGSAADVEVARSALAPDGREDQDYR
jgi:phage terminase small subunit